MQEEIIQLNKLLSLCRNAERGYKIAAQQANDPDLETVLNDYSKQRNEFAYELSQQILIQGENPKERSGLMAGAHRVWINIKGIISGENSKTIIEECLRGERESIKFYKEILNSTTFSNDTRMLLTYQVEEIKKAVRNLQTLG